MEQCDVLIVGGGPAGSSCALGLRGSGLDVLLLDRSEFPRDKTCAGWVTPPVFDELAIDLSEYARENLLQPIHGFRVRRMGGAESQVRSETPLSYGILRRELDTFLLRRCGARLRLGEPLRALERRNGGWIVNGAIRAEVLVGAGGHFCPVARALSSAASARDPIVAARELELELAGGARERCPVRGGLPEIYFTEDLAGYGWLFRKGDWLNIGLGRRDRRHLSEHLHRFLAYLRDQGRLADDPPSRFPGHAYLLYGESSRPLVADAALLVGDAAGLAHPRSGEGIRPAVESGLLAARVLRDTRGRRDAPALAPYRLAIEQRFGRRDPRGRTGPADLLPAPLVRGLTGRLLATRWFTDHVVVRRWFVRAHQRPLPPPEGAGFAPPRPGPIRWRGDHLQPPRETRP